VSAFECNLEDCIGDCLPDGVEMSVLADDLRNGDIQARLALVDGNHVSMIMVRIGHGRDLDRAQLINQMRKAVTSAALALCEYPERFVQ
jgi:hypothetical protein